MRIYVVETMCDYTEQLGFSTSKQIAEKKAKEYSKYLKKSCWVKEYDSGEKNWIEFCGD